jgi:arginyl-tRNA synthetase
VYKDEEPEKEDRIAFLGRAYVEAVKQSEKKKEVKEEISAIYRELENLKGPHVALWKKTRKWSMTYFRERFKELGLTLSFEYFESDLIQETKDVIEDMKEQGIATFSEGAWIVDLEKEKLGVNLLVKSDGTLLYNAKDIALALRKEDDYHPHRNIYVIDARQSHVMQQLFATMKRLGHDSGMEHLSYDFVTLKGGAMSSRKGTVVLYEDLRDKLIDMAGKETEARHPEWSDKKKRKTAEGIAAAAMRFSMLKQDLDKTITFDMEESLSFDGFTGPYLLYSFARMNSLLTKAGKAKRTPNSSLLRTNVEHRLLVLLAEYPAIVFRTGDTFAFAGLAQYLFELCKTFAEFYETVPVLVEKKEETSARLALVEAVKQVLENGLGLLGITPIEEM